MIREHKGKEYKTVSGDCPTCCFFSGSSKSCKSPFVKQSGCCMLEVNEVYEEITKTTLDVQSKLNEIVLSIIKLSNSPNTISLNDMQEVASSTYEMMLVVNGDIERCDDEIQKMIDAAAVNAFLKMLKEIK
jgi:GTP:adenosylcobinamide-phosphate guanylyltransferase